MSIERPSAYREQFRPHTADAVRTIGGVDVQLTSSAAALADMRLAIRKRQPRAFSFCNLHTLNQARLDRDYRDVLNGMTIYNDGIGALIASRIEHGVGFRENLNGTDLVPRLFAAIDRPVSVFLVGSAPGIADAAAERIRKDHPMVTIAGTHHGFFSNEDSDRIVAQIGASGAQLVLVGMGQPRQEYWVHQILSDLAMPVICVGALLDFLSGKIPRAPMLVRKLRMEWAFRLAMEPRRLARRYLFDPIPFFMDSLRRRAGRRSDPA